MRPWALLSRYCFGLIFILSCSYSSLPSEKAISEILSKTFGEEMRFKIETKASIYENRNVFKDGTKTTLLRVSGTVEARSDLYRHMEWEEESLYILGRIQSLGLAFDTLEEFGHPQFLELTLARGSVLPFSAEIVVLNSESWSPKLEVLDFQFGDKNRSLAIALSWPRDRFDAEVLALGSPEAEAYFATLEQKLRQEQKNRESARGEMAMVLAPGRKFLLVFSSPTHKPSFQYVEIQSWEPPDPIDREPPALRFRGKLYGSLGAQGEKVIRDLRGWAALEELGFELFFESQVSPVVFMERRFVYREGRFSVSNAPGLKEYSIEPVVAIPAEFLNAVADKPQAPTNPEKKLTETAP